MIGGIMPNDDILAQVVGMILLILGVFLSIIMVGFALGLATKMFYMGAGWL